MANDALIAALNGITEGVMKGLQLREQRLAREQEAKLKGDQMAQEKLYKERSLDIEEEKAESTAALARETARDRRSRDDATSRYQEGMLAARRSEIAGKYGEDNQQRLKDLRAQVTKYEEQLNERSEEAAALQRRIGRTTDPEKKKILEEQFTQKNEGISILTAERNKILEEIESQRPKGRKPQTASVPRLPDKDQVAINKINTLNSTQELKAFLNTLSPSSPAAKQAILEAAKARKKALEAGQGGMVPGATAAERSYPVE